MNELRNIRKNLYRQLRIKAIDCSKLFFSQEAITCPFCSEILLPWPHMEQMILIWPILPVMQLEVQPEAQAKAIRILPSSGLK
jgi:hypothetical protein